MIKKVLIAEDHESTNISLQKTLEDLGITDPDYVYYCDDALVKIKKAKQDNQTYDLLITDLYFEPDHNTQKIADGAELIKAAREVQPDLRVLIFSAENRPAIIDALFNQQEIDGYVRKARNDAKELKLALENITRNQRHYPRHLTQHVKQLNTYEFSDLDIAIVSLLEQGVRPKDIPDQLQKKQFKAGLSTVEKRLNSMRESLNLTSNPHLVAYCKDMGII